MRLANRLRVGSALACALGIALIGCGEFSTGDCTDKGTCDDGDASVAADTSVATDGAVSADVATSNDASRDGIADVVIDVPRSPDGCALNEICDNGIDDNCDGMADCADPQCGAFACVNSAPMGWSGPVELYDATGSPLPQPPSCGGAFPTMTVDGKATPTAPAATCGCTCGGPTSYLCNSVSVSVFSDGACGTVCGSAALPPNFCVATCTTPVATSSPAAAPQGGSCSPQPSQTITSLSWGHVGRACATASPPKSAGCGAQTVCAPKTASPFSAHLCIEADGEQMCPSGSVYSDRHVYYSGATDTRACTACTCGSPGGGTCSSTITAYSDALCTGSVVGTINAPSTCQSVPATARGYKAGAIITNGGSCTPTGGQTTGTLQPTGAKTVCCTL